MNLKKIQIKFVINGILRSVTIGFVTIFILDQFLKIEDKVFILSIVTSAEIIIGIFGGLARFNMWKIRNKIK